MLKRKYQGNTSMITPASTTPPEKLDLVQFHIHNFQQSCALEKQLFLFIHLLIVYF